jgi:hypothetical protein
MSAELRDALKLLSANSYDQNAAGWRKPGILTHAPFFSLSSLKEKRAGVRRPILQAHEPLAPALSPFGGERELFSFGAGIKMHPRKPDRSTARKK